MIIALSNRKPFKEVRCVYRDPEGRAIAIRFSLYDVAFLVIASHAHNDDWEQAAG